VRATTDRRALGLVVCLFSGCQSVNVHTYTLVPPPPVAASPGTPYPEHNDFFIEDVRIPSEVDRKELVMRRSPRELMILENDQWATPLREEVRHGLTSALRLALEEHSNGALIVTPPSNTGIRIDIRDWEATAHTVYLKVAWRLRAIGSAGHSEIACESDYLEGVTGSANDLVRADQALMDDLARSIARMLRTTSPASCQG
jgi:uncharacterized lipoprotein YmbA